MRIENLDHIRAVGRSAQDFLTNYLRMAWTRGRGTGRRGDGGTGGRGDGGRGIEK